MADQDLSGVMKDVSVYEHARLIKNFSLNTRKRVGALFHIPDTGVVRFSEILSKMACHA